VTTLFDVLSGAVLSGRAQLSTGDYAPLRSAYMMEIAGAMTEYLLTDKARVTKYLADFRRAISETFYPVFELGLVDGGGAAPAEGDDLDWINAKVAAEQGFAAALFQQLKELKAEGPDAWAGEPERRAENYAKTLDGVYSEGKMRGGRDRMLIFDGEDGEESCRQCQRWKGKTHRASFWIKRGLVPGQPGNPAFDCHGYNCNHRLYDAKTGEIWTI
jgi:hypothetical protein